MRDLAAALALAALWGAVTLGGWLVLRGLVPGDWAAVGVTGGLALLLAAGLTLTGGWGAAGFTAPRRWRHRGWLAVPLALVVVPLVAGLRPVDGATMLLFICGYALTGFAEEGVFRGVMPWLLARRDPVTVAAITSILFGLVHLANIVIRGQTGIILAQAVGAACFGFGFAALAWRTGTIWPLVGLHMLHDLFLHLGRLPLIPVAVVQDVILLGLGLLIFWRSGAFTRSRSAPPRPGDWQSARPRSGSRPGGPEIPPPRR